MTRTEWKYVFVSPVPDHHSMNQHNKPPVSTVCYFCSQEGLVMFSFDIDEGILDVPFSTLPGQYLGVAT